MRVQCVRWIAVRNANKFLLLKKNKNKKKSVCCQDKELINSLAKISYQLLVNYEGYMAYCNVSVTNGSASFINPNALVVAAH